MKRVLLTGMSGTGKTSVIRALAARGFRAVDTDDGWCEPLPAGVLADHQAARRCGRGDLAPGRRVSIKASPLTVRHAAGGLLRHACRCRPGAARRRIIACTCNNVTDR